MMMMIKHILVECAPKSKLYPLNEMVGQSEDTAMQL